MNNLTTEKTMTIKEVSKVFGVSRDLIEKRTKELFPNKMEKGKTTYLDQVEVTAIKKRIEQNSSLATSDDRRRLVEMPKTQLEKELLVYQAMTLQQERIHELKEKIIEQGEKIQNLSVKEEVLRRISDSSGLALPSQIGKAITGEPNKFCKWMVDNGILFRQGKDRKLFPKSKYQNRGYFSVKIKEYRGQSYVQTYVTSRGATWLCEKYFQENGLLNFPIESQELNGILEKRK
jgi:phage antirepressor YoqD-like protein